MLTMYGIKNCDTIKKARKWLDEAGIDYVFHDYKNEGVPSEKFTALLGELGWQQLINQRGTTWRKLPAEVRNSTNNDKALTMIGENSSLIKRPLLVDGDRNLLGFKAEQYQNFFNK